jgi:hypothetical protein
VKSDPARRKVATRGGRQKGCYIYIPAEMLQEAGIDVAGPAPHYRLWGGRRGSLLVTLYREA